MSTNPVESLGYDWERVANPAIKPKFPFKVYLPRSTEEVVSAVREAKQFGQQVRIRGGAHSSNDLVLEEGGTILWTSLLNGILDVDTAAGTVLVQSGASLAEVDEHLRQFGYGLPVIADNRAITAGGLASVGGVGPSSPRKGLFLDNVRAVEVVDWAGGLKTCSREKNPAELGKILGGTGRYGVITTLTLDIEPMDKWGTITRRKRFLTRHLDKFISHALHAMENADDFVLQRGMWLEYPSAIRTLRIGQYSTHVAVEPSAWVRLRERMTFGVLHSFGYLAGRLPGPLARAANFLGSLAFIFPPRYSSIKNAETFTEKVVDVRAGEPIRWLAVMTPTKKFPDVCRALHDVCVRYRDTHGCLTMISFYVVGLNSDWLAQGNGERYCDILLHLGVRPDSMTEERLEALVGEVDNICIERGAVRYQHSKTSAKPEIREQVDANLRRQKARPGKAGNGRA